MLMTCEPHFAANSSELDKVLKNYEAPQRKWTTSIRWYQW